MTPAERDQAVEDVTCCIIIGLCIGLVAGTLLAIIGALSVPRDAEQTPAPVRRVVVVEIDPIAPLIRAHRVATGREVQP